MASDNELQIVLTLVDKASAELKKITGDIKKDTEAIGKESEKAGKSLGEGMKEAGKGLKDFKREMFIVTAGIAAITMAAKAWAENNIEARQTLDSIGVSINKMLGSLGSILQPIIDLTEKALQGFVWLFETSAKGWAALRAFFSSGFNMDAALEGFNKFSDSLKNTSNLQEMKNTMQQMADAIARLNLEYMTGALSAQSYYSILTSGDMAAYQAMQTRMQLMQQMAQQENMMNNQSLQDYKTNVESRMGLLQTLQSYHHTVYSGMMDFTNMFIQKFSAGMTTALTSIIMGTKKAGEAFKEFGIAMVTSIVEFVIQYGIQMLIAAALSKIIMASTIAQAGAIAAAWAPAALLASVATLGAADAAGVAGLGAALGAGTAMAAASVAASRAIDLGTITVSKSAGGMAEGGWVGLRGPERVLVGEKGPEYVVPNNRLGSMGRQTSIHIEINNPTVRSDEDIDELTEKISQNLAREAERL